MRTTLLFGLSCATALTLAPRDARAQSSVTGILGSVQRCEPLGANCVSADGAGENPHPPGVLVDDLNFEDCDADLSYQFQIGVSNPSSSYTLEAWVGSQDCSQLANRQTSATSVCWPVAPFSVALTSPYLLNVRMQDIASGAFSTTHPVTYTPADPAACQSSQTGATTLTLYLFFVDAGSNPVGTVQQYPITLDLRAGDVQGAISVTPGGSGGLVVTIPPTTDPDTQSYNVYCDPPPGQGADAGINGCGSSPIGQLAGSSDGGGTTAGDAGGSIAGGTMNEELQYGQPAQKYLCGTGSANARSINLGNLKDGDQYSVAVAAVDAVGNVGPLSNVTCGDADATASGGGGGGGGVSCSAGNAGTPAGTSGLGALMLAAVATCVRKRRK